MFARLLTTLGVAVLTSGLLAATPAAAKWRRAETEHFIAFADLSKDELESRVERLERFDALMRKLLNVEETVKVQVFILPSLSDVQELANNRNVGGFYNASAQLAYGFVPAKFSFNQEGYTPEAVSMHEYTHHMLLGGIDRYVPMWATEGLATLFMTARLDDDGGITVGAPNPAFSTAMYSGSRWSIEKLLKSDKDEIGKSERIELYTRGWALAHYLWLSGKRPGQYAKFIKLLNESGDALSAGREAFGDLDKLNSEVNAYLRRGSFPVSKLTGKQLDASTEISVRELTEGEEAILEYRMRSLLGVDKERSVKLADEARPIGMRFPDDPFVQRTMTEIEYDAAHLNDDLGFEAAETAADRALASDPENLMAMTYKGRIFAQRAIEQDSPELMTEARNWFLRANKVDPNHPLPFELYYDTFVAQGSTPPSDAVNGLFRSTVLMPQDSSLRMKAAIELIRLGDISRARSVLAPAAFYPHVSDDNPMRKIIAKIDEDVSPTELIDWIHEEKHDQRINAYLSAKILQEDEEKEDQEKDGGESKE
ncbi:hypothetical protein [Altererythrobacter sp.]|uniref:hypothetical protein n=1 Tax=Altererythrobacter sp. TaxID=1872480 RepID=UPI003D0A86C5